MNENEDADSGLPQAANLRQQAERRIHNQEFRPVEGLAEVDVRALLHELQVHQIELEMQNEELLRAQTVLQTAWKQAESEREITVELLRLINLRNNRHEFLRSVTALLREWSGCEAVGVRLREGDDFPYFETRGFPPEFVLAENCLCETDVQGEIKRDSQGNPVLECMCGNVICGRFDPAKPFFTTRGNFWSNSTTELLANATEADWQARTRNRCNGEGYESVALILLRASGETFGLLQLNDRRRDRFTPRVISLLERLADSVTLSLANQKALEALRESEERFRLTFDQSPIGKAIVSLDYRFVRVNEMLCRITGYSSEELTRLGFADITHPDDLRKDLEFAQRLAAGEIDYYEMDKRYLRKDSPVVWIHLIVRLLKSASGQPLYFLPTMQDITERKAVEESMRRSEQIQAETERLVVAGRMAAQVAHEINNPLAGIKNSFRLIRDAVPADHPDIDMVERIEREIDRIANIVRQMYELYSPQARKSRNISVHETIRDMRVMLEPLCLKHEVAIEVGSIPSELTVWVPEGSLQQVLHNLTINAIQASPPKGSVNISVSNADKDSVEISIRDHGHGIPAEIWDRIFEPFFSTNTADSTKKGLGLGLSIVKTIVSSIGGTIDFQSNWKTIKVRFRF